MPIAGRAAAIAATSRHTSSAIMGDRYEDDSEEATLLGEEHRHHEREEDLHPETRSQVRMRQPSKDVYLTGFRGQLLQGRVNQGTISRVQFPFDLQVRFALVQCPWSELASDMGTLAAPV